MRILQINDSQKFNGLNINNLSGKDREIIKKDFKVLNALADKYDLTLVSTYEGVSGFSAIDIKVRPLKNKLSFFAKLFRPSAISTYLKEKDSKTFLQAVYDAVDKIQEKI